MLSKMGGAAHARSARHAEQDAKYSNTTFLYHIASLAFYVLFFLAIMFPHTQKRSGRSKMHNNVNSKRK